MVQHLTEHVQQNSRHSSRPPSSDPPQAPGKQVASRAEWTSTRVDHLVMRDTPGRWCRWTKVDSVVPVKPERCRRCQHPLQGEDPQPQRQQVTELPPVKPVVTEYQLHQLVCPACGAATRAELPLGVPTGGFGPRLQATIALVGASAAGHRSDDRTGRALGRGRRGPASSGPPDVARVASRPGRRR